MHRDIIRVEPLSTYLGAWKAPTSVGASFAMSLFRARVTLGRRHSRDTAHAQAGREAVMITRGFAGKQSGSDHADRIPPGQHLVEYFPVLTAGPTPQVELEDWRSARTF
jgi:DMSO/TMAO reductase YedYZ molybdopterin-dependent catalytic subunit